MTREFATSVRPFAGGIMDLYRRPLRRDGAAVLAMNR